MGKALFKVVVLLAVLCFATAYAAKADVYTVSFTGNQGGNGCTAGTGTLTIDPTGAVEFISGTVPDPLCYVGASGGAAPGLSTPIGDDTALLSLTNGTYLENGQMCLQPGGGPPDACTVSNFGVVVSGATITISDTDPFAGGSIVLSLSGPGGPTPSPEPSSLLLLGSGLLALGGVGFFRKALST